MTAFTEEIHAVRAHMVDGSDVDLLLFANRDDATRYIRDLLPLPMGFDSLDIVPRRIIGQIVDRRGDDRDARRRAKRRGLSRILGVYLLAVGSMMWSAWR
jgi:hypothetical protein